MARLKKENILLVGAIFAPLILIGYFLFKPILHTATSDDPQYDLLLSARSYGEPGPDGIVRYTFRAKNKRLTLIAHEAKPGEDSYTTSDIFFFRFDAQTQKLIPLPFDVTDVKKQLDPSSWVVDIPEIETYELTLKKTAPDGYKYARQRHSRMVLFDLFDTATPTPIIKKEGRRIVIPIDHTRFSNIRFHGWILKKGAQKK